MVDASLVLDAIVAVSIAAGAIFAVAELRLMAKDRRTQLLMQIALWATTPEMSENSRKVLFTEFKNRKEAEEKCGYVALDTIATYMTVMGTMLRLRLIPPKLASEYLWIWPYYEKLKPWLEESPVKYGEIEWWEDFRYGAEMDRACKEERMRKLLKRRSTEKRSA